MSAELYIQTCSQKFKVLTGQNTKSQGSLNPYIWNFQPTNQSFVYSPTDALVSCLKKKQY